MIDTMEQKRHFYLTLPSDEGGSEFGGANTNASYSIRLPHPIYLDHEQEWEVAMVSVSFPLRSHQDTYMFSRFWLGSSVAKWGGRAWYRDSRNRLSAGGIEGTVTIGDIVDPYLPPKGGRQFMEHLVFALERSIQAAAVRGIYDTIPHARSVSWAPNSADGTAQGKQRFKWTDRGTLIIEGSNTDQRAGDLFVAFDPRLAEFIGLIEPGSVTVSGARLGRRVRYYYPDVPSIPLGAPLSVEIIDGRPRWVKFGKNVDWEIFGLDDGWYENHMTHGNHVVHVLSNVCDRSVMGGSHNSPLGTAKINATQDGQSYYEPVHVRYLPVRQHVLDVVEIQLREAKRLMNLGAGTTTTVLHFRPAIKGSTKHEKSNVEVIKDAWW